MDDQIFCYVVVASAKIHFDHVSLKKLHPNRSIRLGPTMPQTDIQFSPPLHRRYILVRVVVLIMEVANKFASRHLATSRPSGHRRLLWLCPWLASGVYPTVSCLRPSLARADVSWTD